MRQVEILEERSVKKPFEVLRHRRGSCRQEQKRTVFPPQRVSDLPSRQIDEFFTYLAPLYLVACALPGWCASSCKVLLPLLFNASFWYITPGSIIYCTPRLLYLVGLISHKHQKTNCIPELMYPLLSLAIT